MPLRRSKRKATESHKALSKKTKGLPNAVQEVPESSPKGSEDEPSACPIWLDALPEDICPRIAAYITRDRDAHQPQFLNEDALALALASPKQKDAMAEALDHTPHLGYGDIKSWVQVFEHPRHIDAGEGRGYAVLELLSRSSLRSAVITNRGNQFTAITSGRSVADLSIRIERITAVRFTRMLDALKKLTQLVSLAILCNSHDTCPFHYTLVGDRAYQRLADSCPRLRALHMICHCLGNLDHSPVLNAFPSLKEITVSKPLPDYALPYLCARESVILQSHRRSLCRYASEIGASVTAIKFQGHLWSNFCPGERPMWLSEVSEEEVAMLSNCPRLRELEILLHPGAEKALPETKLLTSLQLRWDFGNGEFEENAWLGTPLDGSFVRHVFAQPLLQKLALVGASIRMQDLEVVLRTTGNSLEELVISATGQPDSMLDRMLGILDSVIRHNDNLRVIQMVESEWIGLPDRETLLSQEPVENRKEFPARFHARVRRLQRKNPWFDHTSLLFSVSGIISHCNWVTDEIP